jgi:hypothetical protein
MKSDGEIYDLITFALSRGYKYSQIRDIVNKKSSTNITSGTIKMALKGEFWQPIRDAFENITRDDFPRFETKIKMSLEDAITFLNKYLTLGKKDAKDELLDDYIAKGFTKYDKAYWNVKLKEKLTILFEGDINNKTPACLLFFDLFRGRRKELYGDTFKPFRTPKQQLKEKNEAEALYKRFVTKKEK